MAASKGLWLKIGDVLGVGLLSDLCRKVSSNVSIDKTQEYLTSFEAVSALCVYTDMVKHYA